MTIDQWKVGQALHGKEAEELLAGFGYEARPGHITSALWGNGAYMAVSIRPEVEEGQDPSDVIEMSITPAGQPEHSWYMNAEDAITLIRLLSTAVERVITMGYPITPDCCAAEEPEDDHTGTQETSSTSKQGAGEER